LAGDHNLGIGALSRRSGVHVETIRYYEKIDLLPGPPRTSGGHRVYSDPHLKRLAFIRRSRELGFTLAEIRTLLGLAKADASCGEVKETALAHLGNIRCKITDLQRMESTLAETAARCEGGETRGCPILEVLSSPE
jgi:MerR family transcriptional regulator, mercuric resistance operon regulatory protein